MAKTDTDEINETALTSEEAKPRRRARPRKKADAEASGPEKPSPESAPTDSVPDKPADAPASGGDQPSPSAQAVSDDRGDGSGGHHAHHGGQRHSGGNEYHGKSFKKGRKNKKFKNRKHFGDRHGGGPSLPPQPLPPSLVTFTGDNPDPAAFNDLDALEKAAAEWSGKGEPIYLDELYTLHLHDLAAFAKELGCEIDIAPNRKQIILQVFAAARESKRPVFDRGFLDLTERGFGFVVHPKNNYAWYPEDAWLPESLVKKYGLKRGHEIEVQVRPPEGNERCPAVLKIRSVMGRPPEEIAGVTPFEELIPYYPLQRILLEIPGGAPVKDVSMRSVDILTPIGFGQRGLIVAPPRTGKTILLQNIANSVAANSPKARLIILLIDERPEEVTDFKRQAKGEVVSSTFDETPESHVHAAEMVGEKARRLVEKGEHVVILLDSITRLARAYNALASNSGKIMSGGMEATALQKPKRFFGAARNIEGGGSLTIMGTALVDTGSRMDEVIFEEFKGTGNMELHLDRGLVEKRVFPAINIDRSGTRKEELLYHPDEMLRIYQLRRALQGVPPVEAMEMLIQRLKKTRTNAEFLLGLNR